MRFHGDTALAMQQNHLLVMGRNNENVDQAAGNSDHLTEWSEDFGRDSERTGDGRIDSY